MTLFTVNVLYISSIYWLPVCLIINNPYQPITVLFLRGFDKILVTKDVA